MTIAETWQRIETWLAHNAPPLAADLKPRADRAAIDAAEAALGRSFPSDFVDSLLVHDGQAEAGFGVFGRWTLMSLERLVDYWQMLVDLAAASTFDGTGAITTRGNVRAVWWDRAWIPFAVDGGGDVLNLDLDPAPSGNVGQIVLFRHALPGRDVIAPSFAEWLKLQADDMEQGRFEVRRSEELRHR